MLEIKNFSKSYTGGEKAVDNLNLTVNAGESVDLLGTMVRARVQQSVLL